MGENYNNEVKDVVEQVINMLTNNVMADYGSEGFENWCEDGEVFKNNGHNGSDLEKREKIMAKLAPYVDRLSLEIFNINEQMNKEEKLNEVLDKVCEKYRNNK